jgi:DNA recombination protein RmuC
MAAGIGGVGAALRSCVEKYNRAAGALETRVLPAARRFKELGISAKEEIASLESLATFPRELAARIAEDGSSTNGS